MADHFSGNAFPGIHGNNNLKNYYNIDKSLPSTLDSNVANAKLQETFDMNNVHMVLLKKGLTSKEKTEMLDQIKDVDGVKWALGMDSFVGAAFPDTMIPSNLKKMLESDEYEMEFICSKYKTATDEVNNQIDEIQKIVKGYSPESMVIGEAPLTKDLQDVTDVDLKTVNTISILAIFIISWLCLNPFRFRLFWLQLLSLRFLSICPFLIIRERKWCS